MGHRDLAQVHVNDFAAFKVAVEEVNNNPLVLSYAGQELVLWDF